MESFEQLVKQYEPMLFRIMHSLHIYKNKEEFYQLGLISLWEARQRFDSAKGSFTNYAYTYIKGKFLTEMTKTNRYEERCFYPKEEFWDIIEDDALPSHLQHTILLSYCQGLTNNQKKWLLYTFLEDLSVKDIAEKEGVSVSTVKLWRKGAKEKLKQRLAFLLK
ncbi:sigma-70 family RNA polymerase sigma factor [Bacillaceae bacterium Marseille-Q3522]|nr:sigma-70 family RNA polymerase sigma factor [Bacillaceae bacterium Marseille-Q3522]